MKDNPNVLTERRHINLCASCANLYYRYAYEIKNSSLAGTEFDNGEDWLECGYGGVFVPADWLSCPNQWGKKRCRDFEPEKEEEK